MAALLLILYAVILLGFILVYLFIIYHLAKYSINAGLNRIILPLFVVISTLLLFSNILLFFSVDWSELLSKIFPV